MIKTIKQYANEKGITTQGVRQLKSIRIIELNLYVEFEGTQLVVGKQKFVLPK